MGVQQPIQLNLKMVQCLPEMETTYRTFNIFVSLNLFAIPHFTREHHHRRPFHLRMDRKRLAVNVFGLLSF